MNMMTLVPKLSKREMIWCKFLWNDYTIGEWRSYRYEEVCPQDIMLMKRDILIEQAHRHLHNRNISPGWHKSLNTLIKKLKK